MNLKIIVFSLFFLSGSSSSLYAKFNIRKTSINALSGIGLVSSLVSLNRSYRAARKIYQEGDTITDQKLRNNPIYANSWRRTTTVRRVLLIDELPMNVEGLEALKWTSYPQKIARDVLVLAVCGAAFYLNNK